MTSCAKKNQKKEIRDVSRENIEFRHVTEIKKHKKPFYIVVDRLQCVNYAIQICQK